MTAATAATDEFVQLTQRSQEAVTTAVRSWTETLQHYAGSITVENPLPSTKDTIVVVDTGSRDRTRVHAQREDGSQSHLQHLREAPGR